MTSATIIGKPIPNVDALDKIRGGYGYPVEFRISGMLHGKILRSPYPHAAVRKIDTSKAERHPEVKAIVTARDFPRVFYHPKIGVDPNGPSQIKDFLVMDDTVRYVGDEVVAVAATSEDAAQEALDLIEVDYDEKPFVLDMEEAVKEGSLKVYAPKDNIATTMSRGWGDTEDGFRQADMVFERTYRTQRVTQFPLETHVCVCDVDRDGNLTVYSSTQMIHGLRERLSTVLEYPFRKVKVVRPKYIGGAFGSKLDMNPMEPICAKLAMKAKIPVRIRLSREEEILSTVFMPTVQKLKTGVRKDGSLVARFCSMLVDGGAQVSHAPSICAVAASSFLASYRSPHVKFDGTIVYTNNPPAGAFRGYGGPQGLFGLEQQLDEISQELGIDPVDLRIRNSWRVGEPNPRLGGDATITSYGFEECLHRGGEVFGWRGLSKPPALPKGRVRGVGMACIPLGGSGVSGKKGGSIEASGAILRLNVDGSVDLTIATIDQGAGQNTILSQITAETLGATLGDIHITYADTDTSLLDAPTHATRVTYVVGSTVKKAAEDLRRRIIDAASSALDATPDSLETRGSVVYVKEDPDRRITFEEVAHKSIFTAPGTMLMGVCSEIPKTNPTPSGAHFAEVEVDTDTGKVTVTRYVAAHDVGVAINPLGVEGQICGAVSQSLGYTLTEQVYFDEHGNPHGVDLADYKVFGTLDMPPVKVVIVEVSDSTGPFGAKGVSEPAVIPVPPAIANAVYNATGVRVSNLPITPESVLKGLAQRNR
ncbi:MAG: molybdopterin-dependent oxidoreductase [Thaumarchaeota archaeon]|nr:molybdopterin-dependent oxidoreductase [Nitrososphaerota archaeon]